MSEVDFDHMVLMLTPPPEDVSRIKAVPDRAYDAEYVRRALYHSALLKTKGDLSAAARLLGINLRTLQRKCPQDPLVYAHLRKQNGLPVRRKDYVPS